MRLPIEKETKGPRQAKFHLSLGSTAKTKSLTIYEITRLYSNCSLIPLHFCICTHTSLSSFTQGAHTSTHHIHDFKGNQSHDRADPGKVLKETRGREAKTRCASDVVRTEKSAHAYSRGKYSGSFVVWDASDSQAKSRLAAESFGYNRSSWLPPFLAGFSPRDRKRRK